MTLHEIVAAIPLQIHKRRYSHASFKRLEAGTVELPAAPSQATHVTLTAPRLALLLGAIGLATAKRRKLYCRRTPTKRPISASL